MELIPGNMYNIKYKIVGDRGTFVLDYKVKVLDKSDDSIKVKILDEDLEGIIKTIKRNKIIEANPVIGGGRRRRLHKTRKSSRKSRKTYRKSRRFCRK